MKFGSRTAEKRERLGFFFSFRISSKGGNFLFWRGRVYSIIFTLGIRESCQYTGGFWQITSAWNTIRNNEREISDLKNYSYVHVRQRVTFCALNWKTSFAELTSIRCRRRADNGVKSWLICAAESCLKHKFTERNLGFGCGRVRLRDCIDESLFEIM